MIKYLIFINDLFKLQVGFKNRVKYAVCVGVDVSNLFAY